MCVVATVTLAACLAAVPAGASLDYLRNDDKLAEAALVPAFQLQRLDGQGVGRDQLIGQKVVLMAFWSVYCKACVEKFGSLVKIRAKYPPDRIEIVSVNTDGEYSLSRQVVAEFLAGLERREQIKINFPVFVEGGSKLAADLGIVFLPAIITVDREGKVIGIYRRISEDSEEEIIRGIETIIPEEAREPPP
jgi:cytochrome oxidase Cu insertion factor (SCO1/SenC/PrrC family)